MYKFSVSNALQSPQGLPSTSAPLPLLVVNVPEWPMEQFPVAVGENVTKAVEAANAAGGGVVVLAAGRHVVSGAGLAFGDGVQLVGSGDAIVSFVATNHHANGDLATEGGEILILPMHAFFTSIH